MAHFSSAPSVGAGFGGKRRPDHHLNYDPPVSFRNSEQRSSVTEETPQKSTNHADGRGSGTASSGEATNEDDDEDSSGNAQDQQEEDDDDEADVNGPTHGHGMGRGKRPAIRVEPVGAMESEHDGEDSSPAVAGPKASNLLVDSILMRNKKRTYSDVSNTSVLCGDNDDVAVEQPTFPRRKMARKLSNISAGRKLLTYKKGVNVNAPQPSDNAFESSDEEEGTVGPANIDIDDEDYSGVNLIPDEDESEEDVQKQEEQWLVDDVQSADALFGDARRLSLDSGGSDNLFSTDAPFADEFFSEHNLPDVDFGQFFEEAQSFSPEPTPARKYSDSSTKRVRFDDEVQVSDSSSSTASEFDNSLWPDLFVEQDKLPQSIYQNIENDIDVDNGDLVSSGSELSYWDCGQDDRNGLLAYNSDDDLSSDAGSSGYETDLGGDTTDEYDSDFASPPPLIQRTPQKGKSVLRRPSSAPGSRAATPKPYQRSEKTGFKGRFIPPICGTFTHYEQNKAIAVTNRFTGTVMFYRPRTTISVPRYPPTYATTSTTTTANNSPRTSIQQLNSEDSDMAELFPNVLPSTDIMLTGVFGTAPNNNSLFNMSAIGPPEAFFPFVDVGLNGAAVLDEEEDYDEDYSETDVNIAEFMDFGSDADATDIEVEMELDTETDVPATPATSILAQNGSTPAVPTPTPTNRKRNASDAMLEHFDRGVVSAFRNNQCQYQEIARLPHDPDLRASISRPIRTGRTADSVISPLRKRGSLPRKHLAGARTATSRLANGVMGAKCGPRMGTFS